MNFVETLPILSYFLTLNIIEIKKKGIESTGSPESEEEIERLLHGYVSMCHNASMEFMQSNLNRAARRVLR